MFNRPPKLPTTSESGFTSTLVHSGDWNTMLLMFTLNRLGVRQSGSKIWKGLSQPDFPYCLVSFLCNRFSPYNYPFLVTSNRNILASTCCVLKFEPCFRHLCEIWRNQALTTLEPIEKILPISQNLTIYRDRVLLEADLPTRNWH